MNPCTLCSSLAKLVSEVQSPSVHGLERLRQGQRRECGFALLVQRLASRLAGNPRVCSACARPVRGPRLRPRTVAVRLGARVRADRSSARDGIRPWWPRIAAVRLGAHARATASGYGDAAMALKCLLVLKILLARRIFHPPLTSSSSPLSGTRPARTCRLPGFPLGGSFDSVSWVGFFARLLEILPFLSERRRVTSRSATTASSRPASSCGHIFHS